jgi:hypothetical protein
VDPVKASQLSVKQELPVDYHSGVSGETFTPVTGAGLIIQRPGLGVIT